MFFFLVLPPMLYAEDKFLLVWKSFSFKTGLFCLFSIDIEEFASFSSPFWFFRLHPRRLFLYIYSFILKHPLTQGNLGLFLG